MNCLKQKQGICECQDYNYEAFEKKLDIKILITPFFLYIISRSPYPATASVQTATLHIRLLFYRHTDAC